MHFFSPANIMKLLEVVRGDKTAPDVLLTAMSLGKKIRKVPVVAGVCHGFIGNRMLMPRQIEATKLLLEGATPEQVDRVHVEFGMPMGPFQMADLAGVDIGWHRDPKPIENVRDALCAIDRWGQKKGAGFYDYDEKRRPTPVAGGRSTIIEDFATKQGVERREISDQEIVERTLYTMVNEGAKILEEGIAQRASDIDVVWVYGYGWPVYRGGPMFWADSVGLAKIVEGLKRQEARMKPDFSFSPAAARQSREGRELHALARGSSSSSAEHRQRDRGDRGAGEEGRGAALAVPQHSGAEACQQRSDPGHEPEGAEAGRAQRLGRAVGDHPRENALRQRHVRAPQADPDHQPGEAVGLGQDQIAGDQRAHAGEQDDARADPVAQRAGGISERDIGQVEQRERQRRQRFAEPDVDPLEDQEPLGKARQREQEPDREQSPGGRVERPEAREKRRALERDADGSPARAAPATRAGRSKRRG